MAIQYFDALAGAGKTHALARYAIQLAAAGERVLLVQPSKQLIDATIRDEFVGERRGLSVRAIHSGNTRNVVQSIIQFTKACDKAAGTVLFITHEAFMRLPYVENRGQWHLIFDEVPTVDMTERFNIAETHHLITDSLSFTPCDADYGMLTPRHDADVHLRRIARNRRADDIWARFRELASQVLSPHWDVFALQSNYHGLMGGDGATHQLVTHSLMRPSIFDGFKQVILASALFTESTLYRLWSTRGVAFTPVADCMLDGLRYRHHGNGGLITIRYLLDRDWSKTLRDKLIFWEGENVAMTLRERIPGLIVPTLDGQRFAWMGNTDIPDDYFGVPEAVRLPNSPHGLNGYQHLHNVVVLSALNATPAHFRFMDMQGVPGDDLRTASYRSAVYQAAMRISIRNPADATPKSITVMDAETAHWLSKLFPGSRVETLSNSALVIPGGVVGRPRKYASGADRARTHRWRKRNREWLGRFSGASDGAVASFGTAYASVYDTEPLLHLDGASLEAFIAFLREAHARVVPSKTENFLLSPAHFEPAGFNCSTRRGLANIRHVNGIWLDNDGGDLSHGDFAKLFPQLRMVVWNTHSSTAEHPRWRCFIPTTEALSIEDHAQLIRQIVMVLKENGFAAHDENVRDPHKMKCHGFDTGKFTAAALFYAPCQAAIPEHSFFVDYGDGCRSPLDVRQMLENATAMFAVREGRQDADGRQDVETPIDAPVSVEPDVSSAINRWRDTPRGQGHRAFFRLACDLRRIGLDRERARHHLLREARYAHSPRDRQADLSQILPRLWGRF